MRSNREIPSWAKDSIEQLRQVEVFLGHIPKGDAFLSDRLGQLMENLQKDQVINEDASEFLFKKIAKGLVDEKFTPEEIAGFINKVVAYDGGPKYCNAQEVLEAL